MLGKYLAVKIIIGPKLSIYSINAKGIIILLLVMQQADTLTIMASQAGWVVAVKDKLCSLNSSVYVAVCIAHAPLIKL